MCFDDGEVAKYPSLSIGDISNRLESRGWNRAIAGDTDFETATKTLRMCNELGVGAIVGGKYGVGKTKLIDAFRSNAIYKIELSVSADPLRKEWQEYHAFNPYEQSIFLDDLGAEPVRSEYGVWSEIVGDFICRWHRLRFAGNKQRPPVRLFITTNLTSEEVAERYGGRVTSRLKDLCLPMRLSGNDKREWLF